MVISIILIMIGFILLIVGANILVDGASEIAKKYGISEIIIGLTVVSIGTSMPELFIGVTSAMQGHSDMVIGNVIGSNLSNLLLILGISAIIRPVKFKKETMLFEVPMCLFATLTFMLFCNLEGSVSTGEGAALLTFFSLFIAYTIYMGKQEQSQILEENKIERSNKTNIIKNIILIILGIIFLKLGGDLTVDNSEIIAKRFGLSDKIIGLTILAFGTSLPELATSIIAAIKGKSDIAIGSIIGSNMFNVLLIMGVSSVIRPISYNFTYNFEFNILLLALAILEYFPLFPPKNKMNKANGLVYLAMYAIYLGNM